MKSIRMICMLLCFVSALGACLVACSNAAQESNSGASNEHTHNYQSVWTMNETHHWKSCKEQNCTAVAGKAEHGFGDWINVNEYEHQKRCECGAAQKGSHTFGQGELLTPATPEAAGEMRYTCADCGATKSESVEYQP